ncbi:MAG: hypothetical protein KBC87_01100 [Candidatus Pacebacteria bacterium]|nr:hypothetical protein [Candidatus Paceibacterota bacterium]
MNREYHHPRSVLATHVTPAILPTDYKDLTSKLHKITSIVDWVQIDVVDGEYAPNKTWPFTEEANGMFTSIVKQDEPMPYWDDMSFEIDLMVKNPAFEVDRWIAAGAMRLVVHLDSIEYDAFLDLARNIEEKGVEMVLGFGVDSSLEKLKKYIDAAEGTNVEVNTIKNNKVINWIQCMGIEKIGFQAQPFDVRVLENIKKIKEMYPAMMISVDGGVNLHTAPQLVEAGADRLVVGSALFTSDSISDTLVKISDTFNV